ncbi:hypothetical protein [Komagataeibacter diospyri]|uniref:hypothetical protein n=1 Tax=Komagataeibacter diospyri TaxID=1932662 RepID=UPI001136BD20|nr:hypothetical protein [Komagataeibacter diospyri]GCE89165.1 hypothetical protein MSKU15_0766 [Komagataeibacter diospyri]
MSTDRTEDRIRLARNRVAGILLASLISYPVAYFVMMDIAHVPGGTASIQLGQIMALACLPVLIVLCFSAYAGLLGVCAAGCVAVLAGLLIS